MRADSVAQNYRVLVVAIVIVGAFTMNPITLIPLVVKVWSEVQLKFNIISISLLRLHRISFLQLQLHAATYQVHSIAYCLT